MEKFWKILLIVLLSLCLFVLLAVLGFKGWDYIRHADFYRTATAELPMPGCQDGFIQQGFDYYEEGNLFLFSGYMNDDSASRVYVVNRNGESHYTALKDGDGDDYTAHAGGASYYGDYLYIAGTKRIDVFRLSDILDESKKEARRIGHMKVDDRYGFRASFCEVAEKDGKAYLYAGAFHDEEPYPTDPKFHLTTPAGDDNRGVLFAFPIDEGAPFSVDFENPAMIYSLPSCVQGLTFTDEGDFVLSTSYGLATSHLYVHDSGAVYASPNLTYGNDIFGKEIPLYYLDSGTLTDTIQAPPMAEEIVYLDGKIWIANESASAKYLFGNLTSGRDVYAVPYS